MAEKETVTEVQDESVKSVIEVNIEDYFTKERAEQGVWFEPNIDGNIGLEFLVIGSESNEAAEVLADYDKSITRINEIKEADKRNEETRVAMANAAAKLVKNLRPAEGRKILINGKPLTYSFDKVYTIMYNSLSIADKVVRFSRKDQSFMMKK